MDFLKICLILAFAHFAASANCGEKGPCKTAFSSKDFDIHKFRVNTPAGGFHMAIGDVVARLHIAQILQGKLLTLDDDYSQMCGKIIAESNVTKSEMDGTYHGFGGKVAIWKCFASDEEKFPGALKCNYRSTSGEYIKNDVQLYVTKTGKRFAIVVMCFPNGQTGWWSHTNGTPLTDEDRKAILDHVEYLGFDRDLVVDFYNNNCPFDSQNKIQDDLKI